MGDIEAFTDLTGRRFGDKRGYRGKVRPDVSLLVGENRDQFHDGRFLDGSAQYSFHSPEGG